MTGQIENQNAKQRIRTRAHDAFFRAVHSRDLVYNFSWEDPRIDRELLSFDEKSRVVVLTGGGCNTLDYLADKPSEIHAVDINPAQNAPLHLKLALLHRGDFDDLDKMFGQGWHPRVHRLLDSLGSLLPEFARRFWQAKEDYFERLGVRRSFYYRGTAGSAAWLFRSTMLATKKRIRHLVYDLFDARTLSEQRELFQKIAPHLWDRSTAWLLNQPVVMTLMGVPRTQIRLIAGSHPDGILGYVRDRLEHVLTNVYTRDNYFWRVYLYGHYSRFSCPTYLSPNVYDDLRERSGAIRVHDESLAGFLERNPGEYTHFVLLDHQDWLAHHAPEALEHEWRQILSNSQKGTKILMRSAALAIDFLPEFVRSAIRFFPERTSRLHSCDRVGTYGSTHLAEVV